MNWPLASDYQDAVQNPRTCFEDPDLKAGHVVLTRLMLPRVASGNFASVYEIHRDVNRWALRCFLRQGSDQQSRYALLSRHLAGLSLPGLVEFAYEPQGIRIRGGWFPIVKMEWVEGTGLHTFIEKHLHDGKALRNLALQWLGLMDRLKQAHIAHCDLQHGNVLVTPQGQLRLVDYDGMFVPALAGRPSLELGHSNYQHPRRTAHDYNENLDAFSALVIYISIRALIVEPGLWAQFHTGENLILSAPDYKTPHSSPAFARLSRHPDPAIRALAQRLAQACTDPIAAMSPFGSLVHGLPEIPEAHPWWEPGSTSSPSPATTHSSAHPTFPPSPPVTPAQPAAPKSKLPPWIDPQPKSLTAPFDIGNASLAPAIPKALDRRPPPAVSDAPRYGRSCMAWTAGTCLTLSLLLGGSLFALDVLYHKVSEYLSPPPAMHRPSTTPTSPRPPAPVKPAPSTHVSHSP